MDERERQIILRRYKSKPINIPKRTAVSQLPTRSFRNLDSDDPDTPAKPHAQLARALTDARSAKLLRRDQLARLANVKPDVIANIETSSGTQPPEALLRKLEQILSVKLPRK
jgi:ribosome-binding protein aMBF1 (putative translation factor)